MYTVAHTPVLGSFGATALSYSCGIRSCSGNDDHTVQVFKALQAQLNRYANAGAQQSTNRALWASLILTVDGKLGASTVNTYKLVAAGLAQGGAAPPVLEKAATRQVLAENAEAVTRHLQTIADRAGLAPGDVSLPSSSGGFGPAPAAPVPVSPEALRRIRDAAFGPIPGYDGGLPADELATFMNKLPGAGTATGKTAWVVGGVTLVGLGLFGLAKLAAKHDD